jgi:hypothetical protein
MTTDYKFRVGYTKGGTATLPANAPTIDIMDCANGSLVVTAGTPTAGTGIPGSYLHTYAGAAGMDLLAVVKTADTTMDQVNLYSYPVIVEIDTKLSAVHGSGAWGGGNGGALSLVYTVSNSLGGVVEGATVDLYANIGMTGNPIDRQVSDVSGVCTFAGLVAGTYYLRAYKDGFGTMTDTEVVS